MLKSVWYGAVKCVLQGLCVWYGAHTSSENPLKRVRGRQREKVGKSEREGVQCVLQGSAVRVLHGVLQCVFQGVFLCVLQCVLQGVLQCVL